MEFNSKTSTHKLATKKDAKKVQKTAIHKKMNEIIGFQEFLDIEEKGRKVTAVLKCTSGGRNNKQFWFKRERQADTTEYNYGERC